MPPIDLDDYRRNQPPGRRRSWRSLGKSSSDGADATQVDSQVDQPTEVQRPPRAASRLTIPVEDLEAFNHGRPGVGPDPYFKDLLDRQRVDGASDPRETSAPEPDSPRTRDPADERQSSPEGTSDGEGDWFEAQATATFQPTTVAPLAPGSATIEPGAVAARKDRGSRPKRGHASRTPDRGRGFARGRRFPSVAGVIGLVVVVVVAVAVVVIGSSSSVPPASSPPELANATSPQQLVSSTKAKTLTPVSSTIMQIADRRFATNKPRASHARPRLHARAAHRVVHPAAVVASGAAPTVASAPVSSTGRSVSAYTAQTTTPVYTASGTGAHTSSGTTRSTARPSRSQPAFGANGALGPGTGGPGTQ